MRDLGQIYDAGRIKGYSRLVVAVYIIAVIAWCFSSSNLVDPLGRPVGYNFITFWSAGLLTLDGRAAAAFDASTIAAVQQSIAPSVAAVFLWHYPPTFQLVAAMLALMPYLVSLTVFVGISLLFYIAVLRRLVPWREAPLLLLCFPGAFICFLHGQNSLVSATLMAGAILSIDRRPLVAGVLIGLLAYKPQLAVLFALAFMAAGRWRALAAAATTAVSFAGLATLALGIDLWATFFANTGTVRHVLESGALDWARIPSVFVSLRMLGVEQSTAYGVHGTIALAVVALTLYVWRRSGPTRLTGATAVAGTLLLSPYTFDYEMAMLIIPLAVLAHDMLDHGSSAAQRIALLILFITPGIFVGLAEVTHVQAGPIILIGVFGWCLQRAYQQSRIVATDKFDWLPGRMFAAFD